MSIERAELDWLRRGHSHISSVAFGRRYLHQGKPCIYAAFRVVAKLADAVEKFPSTARRSLLEHRFFSTASAHFETTLLERCGSTTSKIRTGRHSGIFAITAAVLSGRYKR